MTSGNGLDYEADIGIGHAHEVDFGSREAAEVINGGGIRMMMECEGDVLGLVGSMVTHDKRRRVF